MSIYAKSIQLLLCFMFLLWSIAGPVAQSHVCAAGADTLAPKSEYAATAADKKQEPPRKIPLWKFLQFFDLVPRFMQDLRDGMSISAVKKKYAGHPLWRVHYDRMRYYNGILLIPIGERRCLKVEYGKPWEDIGPLQIAKLVAEKTPPIENVISYPLKDVDPQSVRQILLNTDTFFRKGDFIVQSIILRALMARFPAARVTVVTQYFDLWEGLDRVTLVKTPREIYREPDFFDLVVDLNGAPEERFDAGKKNMVIRIDPDLNAFTFENKNEAKKYVIRGAPLDWWDLRGLHYNVYDFYVTLVRAWGIEPSWRIRPFVSIEPEKKRSLRHSLEEIGVVCVPDPNNPSDYRTERPVILINPYSMIPDKELNGESWVRVIRELLTVIPPDAVILIDRGTVKRHLDSAEVLQRMLRDAGVDQQRVKLLPRLRFKELAALVSKAALVIGVDTSTAHIASALGRSAITVFLKKPSAYYFRPLEWTSPRPHACYLEITCAFAESGGILNDADLPLFTAAVEAQGIIKNGDEARFQALFEKGVPPYDRMKRMSAFFERLLGLLQRGRIAEATGLWRELGQDKDFAAFVSELKEPFRRFFRTELDAFAGYLDDDYLTEGAAGYIAASNLYKCVSQFGRAPVQQVLPIEVPALAGPSGAPGAADYFPQTPQGRKMSRSLYRALRERRWTRAISLFTAYCEKHTELRKLIEAAGLDRVLTEGSREERISLMIACSIICPLQQTAPPAYKNGEPLAIRMRDGTLLKGYFLMSADRTNKLHPTVILLAPWSMNIRALRRHVEYFRNAGFNVVPVDHRHHGDSQGTFFGLTQTGGDDLNEIARFLLAGGNRYAVDPRFLFACGISVGGAIALDAVSREGSPLTHVIAQGVPDITDEFLARNFSNLFFTLPKRMYSVTAIEYIKKLLQAGMRVYFGKDVRQEDVLPQLVTWIRGVKVPVLYIREAGDNLMSDQEYRRKIEPAAQARENVLTFRIRGEHARGHLEDEKAWEHALDAFLALEQVPSLSREKIYSQLLLFESVPALAPRPADLLDLPSICDEAN